MLPAHLVTLFCPACGGGNFLYTSQSGNTIGAQYWSDGKKITPMMRYDPWLVKCPHCLACFWIEGVQCEWEDEPEKFLERPTYLRRLADEQEVTMRKALSRSWRHAVRAVKSLKNIKIASKNGPKPTPPPSPPTPRRSSVFLKDHLMPTEAEYLEVLSLGLPPARERYVRYIIWWNVNDIHRSTENRSHMVFSPEQELNLRRLYDILDDNRPTQRLIKAEIHRELGEFDAALKICAWLDDHRDFAMSRDGNDFLERIERQREMALLRRRDVIQYE